jgi:UDP-2-acetamido-2-deoxy-ribo-hexuluronate aminotransferase
VHGSREKKYHHEVVGINSRLDTLQAAVLLIKLKYLDDWIVARRAKAAIYSDLFTQYGISGVKLPAVDNNYGHI